MKFSPLLSDLIKSLQVLPGVGPKTAKRMAMSLLGGNEADAKNLANNLSRAIDLIGTCQNCRVLSEDQICSICNDSSRDSTQVCVVENTSQVVQIEELGGFKGIYFVLGGYLSPIEGRGPNEIGLSELNSKALSGEIKELILAFNSSLEGEATAQGTEAATETPGKEGEAAKKDEKGKDAPPDKKPAEKKPAEKK